MNKTLCGDESMIHIVNGDIIGDKLQNIEGVVIVWREMYDFGPLSLDWSAEEQLKRRAQFFEEKLAIPAPFFTVNCQSQSRLLDNLSRNEEIILWFEHDRYDQTMLMYLLTNLAAKGFGNLSMVSIDQYPGIQPFHGLGQLSAQQLLELIDWKKKISNEQIEEAISGWEAYNSPHAKAIEDWVTNERHELPYLLQVMENNQNFFPSDTNGLNEMEQLSLTLLKKGVNSFKDLFRLVGERGINDGISDLHFAAILNELTKGNTPLLTCDRPLPNYNQQDYDVQLVMTPEGNDVLAGKSHRADLVGLDWWVGGVHLLAKSL